MKKSYVSLTGVEGLRRVTIAQDPEFLYQLQLGLLLALKDRQVMNEMQCRHAQQKLQQQFRGRRKGVRP